MDQPDFIGPASPADVPGVWLLLHQNLQENTDPATWAQEGFLSFAYPLDFLADQQAAEPIVVAKAASQVVGYCLPTPPSFATRSPLLAPFAELAGGLLYRGQPVGQYRYCLMGQVCVGASHRGQGLIGQLYAAMRAQLRGRYDLVVTEVSTRNLRSRAAHARLGWEDIHQYTDPHHGDTWAVVAWWIGG
jgi:RimJ/RimL family protein N-acetyltransferase